MSYTIEDVSTVKKNVAFTIPSEEVMAELNQAYAKLNAGAKVKGFRPGKTPRAVLERLYGKEVHRDIITDLMQKAFSDYVRESGVNILAFRPREDPKLVPGNPFQFEADIEIKPDLPDIDFKGLELRRNRYRPQDEEIEVQLKMGQRNLAVMQPIQENRPLQEGDFVIMDYEATKDGNPVPEIGSSENYNCKIGLAGIAPEIDAGMIGMNIGERKTISVRFPEDHSNKAVAGLDVVFLVHLKEIREQILPAMDDELAKKLGDYQTLEELKTAIREDLGKRYTQRADQEVHEQVFQKLLAKTEFEVPETMIEYELTGIIQDVEKSFEYHNMSLADRGLDQDKLRAQYRDMAEKQAKRHMILDKIVQQEGLTVSDSDLDEVFAGTAAASGQSVEVIREIYQSNPETIGYLRQGILEKKAMRLIIDSSMITEVDPVRETEPSGEEGVTRDNADPE